ncbi:hypothetical protein BKA69DRAFT_1098121 [Paraphysoderma sedebokerense]|nr:hypothetical protein BKA69DRAFT_1098121 [Paraphysoderma sedebokerense]
MKRLLKILCLHGYTQNASVFSKRTAALRKSLRDVAEFGHSLTLVISFFNCLRTNKLLSVIQSTCLHPITPMVQCQKSLKNRDNLLGGIQEILKTEKCMKA